MAVAPALSTALIAAFFRGLADPARLSCLLAVREHPRTVGEIVALTGLSQPNTSKHLTCLRECGLVRAERSGRFVAYAVADPGVLDILAAAEMLVLSVGESIAACPRYGSGAQR